METVISRHNGKDNHKYRGYGTITFAAPIETDGERVNMAIVVKQTKRNRHKVHRVLATNREVVVLPKKANAESTNTGDIAQRAYLRGEDTPAINSASENNVAETTPDVKSSFSGSKNKDRFSLKGKTGAAKQMETQKAKTLGSWKCWTRRR